MIITTTRVAWWFGWGRFVPGPPEAVVREFLQAAQSGNWGVAQAYMTLHMQGRIGREGFGAMQRLLESRLEPFGVFEIVRVVRLVLPIEEGQAAATVAQAKHATPGRIEGGNSVHAHRFLLQREGRGVWRIYQQERLERTGIRDH